MKTERVASSQHPVARRKTSGGKPGFTLIEMLVVIALAALMASIVAVSLTGSYRSASVEDAAGRIATYDRQAREHARRFGIPGRLVFDLGRGTVTRAAIEGESMSETAGVLQLPTGVHIGRVVTAQGTAAGGQIAVPVSRDGQTASYAVCLTSMKGQEYWIVTAGLTGRTLKVRDEREAQDIFRAMSGDAAGAVAAAGDDSR
jgi:prepilin-type N-terminal cleavage/methylation domain-containing protein